MSRGAGATSASRPSRFDGRIERRDDDRETCVVLLSGRAARCWGSATAARDDVFDGPPTALYVPPRTSVVGRGRRRARASAPRRPTRRPRAAPARRARARDPRRRHRGARISNILMEDRAGRVAARHRGRDAGRSLVELPAAQARHRRPAERDAARGDLLPPARGGAASAFQRVYTDDRELDEALAVADGDVVLVPRGYHPVAGRPAARPLLPERHGRARARVARVGRARLLTAASARPPSSSDAGAPPPAADAAVACSASRSSDAARRPISSSFRPQRRQRRIEQVAERAGRRTRRAPRPPGRRRPRGAARAQRAERERPRPRSRRPSAGLRAAISAIHRRRAAVRRPGLRRPNCHVVLALDEPELARPAAR